MENFKRKAIVSLISSYASQFASTAINFACKLIIARLIAPGDLGLYTKALFILMGCDMLMDLGVTQHVAREKHRPYGTYLMLRLLAAAMLIALIEVGAGSFSQWGADLPAVMRVFAVVIIIKAASGVPNLFMERELIIHRSVVPQLLRLTSTGLVSIVLARFHFGVWALVYGTITGEAMFAITMWASAWGRIPVVAIPWKNAARLVWDSKFLFLLAFMGFAIQQGDIAITGNLLDNKQVGYYAMAYSMVIILSKVVESAVFRVIYPLFCEYRDDLVNLGRIYRNATLAVYAIEVPIYLYLLFNATLIMPLILGEKWVPAARLMQAFSVYGIINPLCTFGNEVLRARKQDGTLILSTAITAVSLIAGGYILTSRYGAIGMVGANYIIVGAVPVILSLYRSIRGDLAKLAVQLLFVYATALGAFIVTRVAFSSSPVILAVVDSLLIPVFWYIYYRMFGNGFGRRTISSLRSPAAAEVSETT